MKLRALRKQKQRIIGLRVARGKWRKACFTKTDWDQEFYKLYLYMRKTKEAFFRSLKQ